MIVKIGYPRKMQVQRSSGRRLVWASLLAMSTATTANLGLYAAAGYIFPEVAAWTGTGPVQIVVATIVYLLMATLVFGAIRRLSSRPDRHYLIVASIALLLSMGPPIALGSSYGLPGVPPADAVVAITLGLMHVVSFAISVPIFIRLALD